MKRYGNICRDYMQDSSAEILHGSSAYITLLRDPLLLFFIPFTS
jgi:hypothetical protein